MLTMRFLLAVTLIFTIFSCLAVEDAVHSLETDAQRKQYVKLSEELRCPKCQNQNLSDSNSEIADVMRAVIAEETLAGKTESDIKQMMVDRYGDFVLYEPPVTAETLVLWWAPVAMLGLAFLAFVRIVVIRSKNVGSDDDSVDNS